MTIQRETGSQGEWIACGYLSSKGYSVIDRNFSRPFGEIDIVCVAPDKTLVFFEIKTVRLSGRVMAEFTPEDHLTPSKLFRLRKICSFYAAAHPHLVHDSRGWRIDLLALTLSEKDCLVSHYPNIAWR